MNDTHMPESSWPNVICNAENLHFNPSLTIKARCPVHRPGYMCLTQTYHHYDSGAFGLACEWPEMNLTDFPTDHLRDIMGGLVPHGSDGLPKAGSSCFVASAPLPLILSVIFLNNANVQQHIQFS